MCVHGIKFILLTHVSTREYVTRSVFPQRHPAMTFDRWSEITARRAPGESTIVAIEILKSEI